MSVNNQIIKIEPSILIWARESIGLTQNDVAEKINKDIDTIKQWELGKAFPSLSQLEKLAYSIYKRPLAVFFLPKPPQESTPKQDFRTLPEKEISKLSPELRVWIRKAKYNQLVLKEINDNRNPVEKPIHKEFKFKLSADVTKIAQRVREYLDVTRDLQKGFKDSYTAFIYYRNFIEKQGVYVFQYPLHEVRGFSLMDIEFPVIVLNSSDTPNGKNFTLFHELCHILFNTGGIFRDPYSQELKQDKDQIEIFCNQFASEFLLPDAELQNEKLVLENKNSKEWTDEVIQELANTYKVSKDVVLRKLLDLSKTTQSFYNTTTRRWAASYRKQKEEKKKQEGGPSYHTTNRSHLGNNFISNVLTGYHEGKVTASQVSDFLGIKIDRIREYEQKVF
jgi:Zn-dependent peptidase ImmA (M78 family)/transcriptional regulator with XRE-family HTH domain